MATFSSHRLIMGKVEIDNFIFGFVLQKCLLSIPLRFIRLLSKSVNLIGCRAAKRVNFCKKCLKIFFSETIRGKEPKLCIHAKDISLYISYVFYSGRIRTLVAMATYSSHRHTMGKVENNSFCCLTGDI